ncbi:MAG TPA: S8 family serine peptidase [Pyrinomonadaceae bacterium]|nr:S8 family serine peptidase [Pyrinomonadaceae bacterium]
MSGSALQAQTLTQVIVKALPDDLPAILATSGGAVVDAIPGYYLISVPANTDPATIEAIIGRGPIQAGLNTPLNIPRKEFRPNYATGTPSSPAPPVGSAANWFGSPARTAYTTQPAIAKVQLQSALGIATGRNVRVAIIDTGVDFNHPTLRSVLLPGKNYVGQTTVPSEFDDPIVAQSTADILDQSTADILDQSTADILDQSTADILDQSTADILDQSTADILDQLPAFGHGTMMAGLVHLSAPNASIIPLKVFDATGSASKWNIVRAIYDAVNMGADVISMSFSSESKSKMIEAALNFAISQGVVPIAATGNDDSDAPTYPAFIQGTVGVSAVDMSDQKAGFSNYGPYVNISAPGVDLVTTYPFNGRFARGSGTSGAVAFAAGIYASAKQSTIVGGSTLRQKVEGNTDPLLYVLPQYQNKLGTGRINALGAVN